VLSAFYLKKPCLSKAKNKRPYSSYTLLEREDAIVFLIVLVLLYSHKGR